MLGKVIFENNPSLISTHLQHKIRMIYNYLNIYSVFQSLGHFKPVRDKKKISCHDTMRLHHQSFKYQIKEKYMYHAVSLIYNKTNSLHYISHYM